MHDDFDPDKNEIASRDIGYLILPEVAGGIFGAMNKSFSCCKALNNFLEFQQIVTADGAEGLKCKKLGRLQIFIIL